MAKKSEMISAKRTVEVGGEPQEQERQFPVELWDKFPPHKWGWKQVVSPAPKSVAGSKTKE